MGNPELNNQSGQAVIEYVLVLFFIAFISYGMIGQFGGFLSRSIGTLNHVLSINLNVGVCPRNCFFSGYKNGFNQ